MSCKTCQKKKGDCYYHKVEKPCLKCPQKAKGESPEEGATQEKREENR